MTVCCLSFAMEEEHPPWLFFLLSLGSGRGQTEKSRKAKKLTMFGCLGAYQLGLGQMGARDTPDTPGAAEQGLCEYKCPPPMLINSLFGVSRWREWGKGVKY